MPSPPSVDSGNVYNMLGLSAGALNEYLVPAMDVSQWKWLNLYVASDVYDGQLEFQYSFDQVTWNDLTMYLMPPVSSAFGSTDTVDSNVLYGTPVYFPFFRVQMGVYTSGTARGVVQLFKDGLSGFQLFTVDSVLASGLSQIGFIRNDGVESVSIAVGHTLDTVITNTRSMLSSILITDAGSTQVTVYDNDSAASGTKVGIISASDAAIVGKILTFHTSAENGLYLVGSASNPGMSVFFSERSFDA